MVNSAGLAKRIGYDYLESIYRESGGPRQPMQAVLAQGVWHIRDTLPEGDIGGEKYIEICQSNGRVLNFFATQ